MTPGERQDAILALMVDGATWTSARLAEAIGDAHPTTRKALSGMRKGGLLELVPSTPGSRYPYAGYRLVRP